MDGGVKVWCTLVSTDSPPERKRKRLKARCSYPSFTSSLSLQALEGWSEAAARTGWPFVKWGGGGSGSGGIVLGYGFGGERPWRVSSPGPQQAFDFSLQVSCALHSSDECSLSAMISSEAISPACRWARESFWLRRVWLWFYLLINKELH